MSRDWESAYLRGETPWDKGYASPPLMEFLRKHRIAGRVLVPGCGTGHDVRALAVQGAEVLGLDIAPGAIAKAKEAASAGEECYALGDFLNPDPALRGAFEWVVEHTCLCALEYAQRTAYAASVQAVLKPGGHYLAVFYRHVPDYDGDGPPHPISGEEIDGLFGEHFEVLERFVPHEGYPSRPYGSEEVCRMRLK